MKWFAGRRALVAVPLLALVCFAIPAAGAGAAAPTGTRIVAPKPQLPKGAQQLGAVSPSATVSGAVVLQPRDEAALTRFISQVTDKHSALFHQYLTPGTFAARFGPTPAAIAAVKSQLQREGLAVTSVARDGMIIDFKGSANQVEGAFRTGLDRYKLANEKIGRARTGAIRVPATIAKYVTSVVGLDTTVKVHAEGIRTPRSARGEFPAAKSGGNFIHPAGSPTACSEAASTAQDFGGLTDDQIANAYGAFGLYSAGDTGAGQSIAVVELEPFATSDLQTFDTCFFGATHAATMLSHVHTIAVDGGQPAGPGSGESILDIQDVSAFAPGASIDVYEAPNNTFGSLDMFAQIVNDDKDQVVTTSWGVCEQAVQQGSPGVQEAENQIFQQAAAQGQTVFSAAGDTGSDDCNAFRATTPVTPVLSVDDPSSQPYVVAAGGTTMEDPTPPASEHVWNDGPMFGAGGGGISESWPMPTWQLDSKVPGINNSTAVIDANAFEAGDLGEPGYAFCASDNNVGPLEDGCRELPDVSAVADEFTGITIYQASQGGWYTIGGTSSAAPMWAGMLADVNESPTCHNNVATKNGVGFVSPLLYSVASNPASYAASFNDITTGNDDPYGASNLFQATTGYDMASGLGTPHLTAPGGGPGLAFYLCSQAPAATRPTVTSVSPAFGPTGNTQTTVTITGTNFEKSGGASNVAGVQVGDVQLPAAAITNITATTITADFPSSLDAIPPNDQTDGAGRAEVTVTLDDGESSTVGLNSTFTYVDENGGSQTIPAVIGVHTSAGPDTGGNSVDIYGSGFSAVTGPAGVTFGGIDATSYQVKSDWLIQATVPAFQNGTTTCDEDGSSFGTGENATNDICQTQVVVTNANGSSKTSTIQPFFEGDITITADGTIPAPPGNEAAPAATEYDYAPTPTITSISTDDGPASLASEEGGSVVVIDGTGFNSAALDSVNFGDPTQASSQVSILNVISVTGTEMVLEAPGTANLTVNPTTVPVTVQSAAGLSSPTDATYAGIPTITSVTATAGPSTGKPAGPDTGGTPIEIDGSGLANQVLAVAFNDVASPFSFGTQYNFDAVSNTKLTTSTVPENPAVVDTQVCTATDCSTPSSATAGDTADFFILYPPGDPKIDSITPDTGPANGGTKVTITGENLGCVDSISFGGVDALTFSNAAALLDCGATNTVTVTTPAASVGTVPVTLNTVESDATGAAPATGSFTFTQPPAQTLSVHKSGNGAGKVTSSPGGISCGSTCSHKFTYGSSVTLKAKASTGSRFTGWSGACSGKSTCKVTESDALTATAKFTLRNCVVPNVEGKSLSGAKRSLKGHFCKAGKIKHAFSDKVKTGHVVSQSPKAGSHLKHSGKVRLVLSEGKKP